MFNFQSLFWDVWRYLTIKCESYSDLNKFRWLHPFLCDKEEEIDAVLQRVKEQVIFNSNPPSGRGGRLTSLDASFARCFAFWRTSSKTSTSMFFQKNRQNIASLRKKPDVLHDVLGFRNSIQSYDKSLVT